MTYCNIVDCNITCTILFNFLVCVLCMAFRNVVCSVLLYMTICYLKRGNILYTTLCNFVGCNILCMSLRSFVSCFILCVLCNFVNCVFLGITLHDLVNCVLLCMTLCKFVGLVFLCILRLFSQAVLFRIWQSVASWVVFLFMAVYLYVQWSLPFTLSRFVDCILLLIASPVLKM
jgi:hypothetical protein